jgi:hypothetical protein
MGNYSYLLKVFNCKNTKIIWENCKDELLELIKDRDNYFYFEDEETFDNIISLEDLAKHLNGNKFFGYLTNPTCKILCKICLNTEFVNTNKCEMPIMYFEEEGWNRIHYLKFDIKTENIEWYSYAYDFDFDYHEEKLRQQFKKEKNCIEKFRDKIMNTEVDIWELVEEKKKDYIYNLIYDKATNWRQNNFSYNQPKQDYNNIETILYMFGIRHEDF